MPRGYNLSFKMHMEGIEVPFKSANIICTPNGVEANINIYHNKYVYDIKPKTMVQIFFKDWAPNGGKPGWRLMFDGFFSSYYKEDESTQGRMIGIVCRDFRMDLRKAPAALAYTGDSERTSRHLFNMHGLYTRTVVPGMSTPKHPKSVATREYENQLSPLSSELRYIAGTAYGAGAKQDPKTGEWFYSKKYADTPVDKWGKADCRFFLDALIRGIWTEAVGGTSVGAFLNKRTKCDKRFLIPSNKAGYNFWSRQSAGLQMGSYVMMDSRFVSLEVAIMRIAALFSVRVYSCNTPALIPISETVNGQPNPTIDYIMDQKVRKFLVDRASAEFGAPYILNEGMLLPPLEFTAPPNCNLFLPPICNRVSWQYDMDADITRGYYSVVNSLSGYDSTQGLNMLGIQVPNLLFDLNDQEGSKKDKYGRRKPPITLEERYKGVSLTYGQVNLDLAMNEANTEQLDSILRKKQAKIRETKTEEITRGGSVTSPAVLNHLAPELREQAEKNINDKLEKMKISTQVPVQTATTNAMRRHAILKYLNEKYAGRVITIDMMFNPYPMCGFPGMFVDDDEAGGEQSSKSVLGMVQQVKHIIHISSEGAEASTTVIMNDARFIDEPTDLSPDGNAYYLKPTDPIAAEIDPKTLKFVSEMKANPVHHYVPEPKQATERVVNPRAYDLNQNKEIKDYIYVKDFLSITQRWSEGGKSNKLYVDSDYEPQRICKFYKDVLQHSKPHFMIGTRFVENRNVFFVYDSMHEALVELKNTKKELLTEYDRAMEFISRGICSADAFYQGILGASVQGEILEPDPAHPGNYISKGFGYICNTNNFDDTRIEDEYFGVTTALWNSGKIEELKAAPQAALAKGWTQSKGLMTHEGQCSSILETMPITAFIEERKQSVKKYITSTSQTAQGMRFK